MTINYTTLLGLAEPVTGTESGTWGDDVNLGITLYLDIAIAGTNNITQDSDITLTTTNGSSAGSNIVASPNSTTAQYMQLLCTGARTANRNINAPNSSKMYVVNNSTTGGYSITIRGTTGPTTGVTIASGEKAIVFWSSVASDFVKISSSSVFGPITASSITDSGLTSGRVTYAGTAGLLQDSANLTFNGTTLTANTIGAFTLGGTIAGGGNQINNVIIGTSTPLAGSFTTLTASTSITNSGLTSGRVTFAGTGGLLQDSANFTWSGTALALGSSILFQGDFSNATVASRTAFQTSTTNSSTGIYALPNGTSTAASWQATNNATPTNASKILIATNGSTDVQLVSGINGTGTYLPLTFWNNGAEQMRLAVNGNFGVGDNNPAVKMTIVGTDAIMIPKGTTGQQPTGVAGYLRFNTTTTQFEGYNGTTWASVGQTSSANAYAWFIS